jgi:hypothetical protein
VLAAHPAAGSATVSVSAGDSVYSGASPIQTPPGQKKVSWLESCPGWGCPYRGVPCGLRHSGIVPPSLEYEPQQISLGVIDGLSVADDISMPSSKGQSDTVSVYTCVHTSFVCVCAKEYVTLLETWPLPTLSAYCPVTCGDAALKGVVWEGSQWKAWPGKGAP